ncbi:MAG: ATP-binding protein [Anaerolineales bacterium]
MLTLAGVSLPFLLLSFWLLKFRRLSLSAFVLMSMVIVVVTTAQVFSGEGIHNITILFYPMTLILSARFLSRFGTGVVVTLMIVATGTVAYAEMSGIFPSLYAQQLPHALKEDMAIITIILIASAVTSRLMVERLYESLARARQSEERYRIISDVASDYIFESRFDEQGNLLNSWIAGAFESISGYTIEEFHARGGWRATLHPDDLPQDDRDMDTLRANKKVDSKLRIITKTGQIRWVRVLASPIWDEEHNLLRGVYGAVQDITAQEETQAQVRRLNVELEQRVVERTRELEAALTELESFSYSISHDLRAPLRALNGYASILLGDHRASLDAPSLDYAKLIESNARRMGVMIDGLITFLQLNRKTLRRETLDTKRLVLEVVRPMITENPHLDLRIDDLPPCHADPDLLAQVFTSLLSNAVKFSRERNPAIVKVGAFMRNGRTTFFVQDNGAGFDMRYQSKLFGVFQKLHQVHEYEGEGLSLAIVQRIIQRHGGQIWAEAEVNKGATFYFTLA